MRTLLVVLNAINVSYNTACVRGSQRPWQPAFSHRTTAQIDTNNGRGLVDETGARLDRCARSFITAALCRGKTREMSKAEHVRRSAAANCLVLYT